MLFLIFLLSYIFLIFLIFLWLDAISYIPPTDKVFTFSKINVVTVNNLLKTINANKATGPDNIPSRLLKIASDILAPSLTEIFNK